MTDELVSLLRAELADRGISQRWLALRSGVNHATISRILGGSRTDPTLRTTVALLAAIGYRVEFRR